MKKISCIALSICFYTLSNAQEVKVQKISKSIVAPVLLKSQVQMNNSNVILDSRNFDVKKESNEKNVISAVTMLTENYGFAIGTTIVNGGYYNGGSEKSKLWITKNRTDTWNEVIVDENEALSYTQLVSIDGQNLFLHARPFSYLSLDAGKTWKKTVNNPTTYLSKLTVYKNGTIVGAGSTKVTYSTDFGNTWSALALPSGFNNEAVTLEGQMIGAVVQDGTLKLLTVEEELNYDIVSNTLLRRGMNNFPKEIKLSKKRFFKSHENGDFTLIFNISNADKSKISSGISVYNSSDNAANWTKLFDYKEDNLMHISDVQKDENGLSIVTKEELLFYKKDAEKDNKESIFPPLAVLVYPNPSTGIFEINSSTPINSIEVFSIVGESIRTEFVNSTSYQLNLSEYAKTVYFLKINTNQGSEMQKILLK